jgi:hypothetical protein
MYIVFLFLKNFLLSSNDRVWSLGSGRIERKMGGEACVCVRAEKAGQEWSGVRRGEKCAVWEVEGERRFGVRKGRGGVEFFFWCGGEGAGGGEGELMENDIFF